MQMALFDTAAPAPAAVAPAAFPLPSYYNRTVHAIGRCVVKGCKQRRRNTLPAYVETTRRGTTTRYAINTRYGLVAPHSRWHGDTPTVTALATLYAETDRGVIEFILAMRGVGWICPDHDRVMKVAAVEGVVNVDKSCNARCMGATGPSCECACGGDNHGGRWG